MRFEAYEFGPDEWRIRDTLDGSDAVNRFGELRKYGKFKNANREVKKLNSDAPAKALDEKLAQQLGDAGSLNQRAVLVDLNITVWSARKVDQEISSRITAEAGASDTDAIRASKRLLTSEALSRILSIAQTARNIHSEMSLPWSRERILSIKSLEDYIEQIGELKDRFEAARDQFIKQYDDCIAAAAGSLGDLFKPDDYPSVEAIADKFSFEFEIKPVPDQSDFRAAVSQEQAAMIRERLTRSVIEHEKAATEDGLRQLTEAVVGLANQLRSEPQTGKDGRKRAVVHTTTLKSLRARMERFTLMDISAGRQLSEMATAVANLLSTDEARVMREDKSAREAFADQLDQIAEQVDAYA